MVGHDLPGHGRGRHVASGRPLGAIASAVTTSCRTPRQPAVAG
jgi:hypothetical protein